MGAKAGRALAGCVLKSRPRNSGFIPQASGSKSQLFIRNTWKSLKNADVQIPHKTYIRIFLDVKLVKLPRRFLYLTGLRATHLTDEDLLKGFLSYDVSFRAPQSL